MRKFLLALCLAFLLPLTIGCGDSDEFNFTSTNNNTNQGGLSGQTGTINIQTQLATANQTDAEVVVFEDTVIPAAVDELRFTGFNQNGAPIYGPVVLAKSANLVLENVPVEVVTLRVELLTEGFIVGGTSLSVNVATGETTVVTNPTYVFLGAEQPATAYGSFALDPDEGFSEEEPPEVPEGGFPAADAPVLDFPTQLAAVNVTRVSPGVYSVSESGDYLLTYSVETIDFFGFGGMFVQVVRNDAYVPGTFLDLTSVPFLRIPVNIMGQFTNRGIQSFQFIVSLEAGDEVSLRVPEFFFDDEEQSAREGEFNAQTAEQDFEFPFVQGTFTVTRLGEASQ